MLSVAAAESRILSAIHPFDSQYDSEQIPLMDCLGRILSEDIASNLDFPHWDNSAMDGYAFRYADLEQYDVLEIAAENIPAGAGTPKPLLAGECVRILTGGMLPEGADTVVMQEDTERDGNYLKLKAKPEAGSYVRHKGAFYRAGEPLLGKGTKLTATEIGLLAAAKCGTVPVYRRPTVAILSTGSELVELLDRQPLQPGQIVDSNQYTLAALVTGMGAIARPIGIVHDRKELLAAAMAYAMESADIAISTGGASVGDFDYVDEILVKMGAEIHFRAVAIKPGKPLTFATFDDEERRPKFYFGVPGNPVSATVCFWRFIAGAISKLSGANESNWYPQFVTAATLGDLHAGGRRETYLWGHLRSQSGRWQFQPVDNYSSGNLVSVAGTNGLAVLKMNQTYVPTGDEVLVMQV